MQLFMSKFTLVIITIVALFFSVGCSGEDKKEEVKVEKPAVESAISVKVQDINTTITDSLQTISFLITSSNEIESFEVKVNNIDKTNLVTLKDNILKIEPTAEDSLPFDYIFVSLELTDTEGFVYSETFNFNVDIDIPIVVGLSASPQSGYAPLDIIFSPIVNSAESIQLYHWDFGDGSVSDSNSSRENLIGSPIEHTYKEVGKYTVTLKVYDSNYQPATSEIVIDILNEPPVVIKVESSPSNGALPLSTAFSVSASDSEGIEAFLWDFDNDGVIDFNDTITSSYNKTASSYKTYIYDSVGEFNAKVTIVDVTGASTVVSVPSISVLVGEVGTPSVRGYVTPASGVAPFEVTLSTYAYNPTVKWEWDFDNDGVYDYESSINEKVNHTYTVAGTYFPRVRVTNAEGLSSSDTVEVTVEQDISLTRTSDTIDVKSAEESTIEVSVAGVANTSLIIEDRNKKTVKTLLDWKERSGIFTASWDGADGDGSVLAQGDYYAVLLYKEGGESKRFDLRDDRDNKDIALKTNILAGDTFAPYLEPMLIEFNLTEASEVSLDIGPDGTSVTERIKTILLKEPLGKGFYSFRWAGDANDGTVADLSLYKDKYPSDADYYMTGGFTNKLADNAIFVKSGVSITNLTTDIPIYIPNALDENAQRNKLLISFDLSVNASVMLTINDASTGALIASKAYDTLTKGSNTIEWDGRDENGKYIAPEVYRIGLKATDIYGYTSLTQYALQRIFY